jgi:hypothetical protein
MFGVVIAVLSEEPRFGRCRWCGSLLTKAYAGSLPTFNDIQ